MGKKRRQETMATSGKEARGKKVAFGIGLFVFLTVLYFITVFVLAYRL